MTKDSALIGVIYLHRNIRYIHTNVWTVQACQQCHSILDRSMWHLVHRCQLM
eukprot:COSAG01_NODE_5758_length_4053_cov_12.093576_2_plen_52_part_00